MKLRKRISLSCFAVIAGALLMAAVPRLPGLR